MAKKRGARTFPVEIDVNDLEFRCNAAMIVAGLTVRDVGDYMGCNPKYVQSAINGNEYYMNLHFLVSFCAICRCTVADLLPFANDQIPFPFTYSVPGGGGVQSIAPSPYAIAYSDPEDLKDRRWYGAEQRE